MLLDHKKYLTLVAGLSLLAPVSLLAQDAAPKPTGPPYGHSMKGEAFNEGPRQKAYLMKGMAKIVFPVTTKNKQAQKFFEQGISQIHAYWSFEAERSFRQVAALDPNCAMAYWGMAMANVHNETRAKEFIEKAFEARENASEREKLWIEALYEFYYGDKKQEAENRDESKKEAVRERRTPGKREGKRSRNQDYIAALQKIVDKYPKDLEAKAFLAHEWYQHLDDEPKRKREDVDKLMNEVLAADPMHPVHHYRIHLWNYSDDSKAVNSAARCGESSPGIAHMWHMEGHTYTKLDRFADAAYSQEASARVDHAYMMRDRVMPDQIHNYAHNNQWLVETLNFVGRAHEAVDLAKNMIELPRHPNYNVMTGFGSASQGRNRLLQTLANYELWDETKALNAQGLLEPGVNPNREVERLELLATACFASSDISGGKKFLAELEAAAAKRKSENSDEKAKTLDALASQGRIPGSLLPFSKVKNFRTWIGSVEWKDNASVFDEKDWKAAVAAVRAYEALAENRIEDAGKHLDEAKSIPKSRMAHLRLRVGQKEKAEELAREAVKNGKNQALPLAALVEVLYQVGKKDEAKKNFEELRRLAERADLDVEPLARLAPIAKELGCPTDWRLPQPPATDILPRPGLASLGPFRWGPSAAPNFSLPDANGRRVSLQDYQKQGRAVLVIFYLGSGCEPCISQLNAFAPMTSEFEKAGISLVAIGPETPALSKKLLESQSADKRFTFPLLSDTSLRLFKTYRAYDDFEEMALHGAYLIDPSGLIRWQDIGFQPFNDAKFVLEESKRLLHQNRSAARTADRRSGPVKVTSRQIGQD